MIESARLYKRSNSPIFAQQVSNFQIYKDINIAQAVEFWSKAMFSMLSTQQHQSLFEGRITWTVQVKDCTFGTMVGSVNTIDCEPAKVLLETGIALTPASHGTDVQAGFALLRYGPYFANLNGSLSFPAECEEMEQRQKSAMAEELSVGMTCHLVREYLKCLHIVDFLSALNQKEEDRLVGYRIPGHTKRPDFCCFNKMDELIFVESKGTFAKNRLPEKLREGLNQIESVKAVGKREAGSHFVIGTFLGTDDEQSSTDIVDPNGSHEQNELGSDLHIRLSYAKVLRFAQRSDLAESLLLRKDWEVDFGKLVYPDVGYYPVGLDPFGNMLLLDAKVFKLLSRGRTNLVQDLKNFVPTQSDGKIILNNGVALLPPWS